MSTRICILLGLAIFLAARPAFGAGADGKKFLMVVVAQRAGPASNSARPTEAQPVYYVAYDSGYVDAGDPIAGESPPEPGVVAQALHQTLAAQDFRPATMQSPPSVALVYSWGVLSPDTAGGRSNFRVKPNPLSGVTVVSAAQNAGKINQTVVGTDQGSPQASIQGSTQGFHVYSNSEPYTVDFALNERYFAVVSAYDFAALRNGEARLLWRTRMSTRAAGVAMSDALPALLNGAGPYFGRNLDDPQNFRAPLYPTWSGSAVAPGEPATAPPAEITRQVDEQLLHDLLAAEHREFSGEPFEARPRNGSLAAPTPSGPAALSFLPPVLAARINTYEYEKSTLQDALTARIGAHTPGADTRQAIDDFNQENAGRIAALTREREAIRDELAMLAAATTDAAAGKSINTLLQEFAAGPVQPKISQPAEPGTRPASSPSSATQHL